MSDEAFLQWIAMREKAAAGANSSRERQLFMEPDVQSFVAWLQEEEDDEEDSSEGE